jgi:hypothetical protein
MCINFPIITKTFANLIIKSIQIKKEDFSLQIYAILDKINKLLKRFNCGIILEIFFHNLRKIINQCDKNKNFYILNHLIKLKHNYLP